MSETVIKIEHLYKEYRLGVIGHGTLYRDLQSWWANARGKEDPNSKIGSPNFRSDGSSILALEDINLEVKKDEALGIIGANGAGKSTLLKILSRITTPTKGTIKIRGRIASLLEVGTGFHNELTGKENIYLNGAINGMPKSEIAKKMDEIVDFAGVEKFLETPVKRYSSGMFVRLAFAVAAHLDPEILIVDEVLAVGDYKFRKKAINKMQEATQSQNKTVLFVSHDLESIERMCSKLIVLHEGKILFEGSVKEGLALYKNEKLVRSEKVWNNVNTCPGSDLVKLKEIYTTDFKKERKAVYEITEDILVNIMYSVLNDGNTLCAFIEVNNEFQQHVFQSFDNSIQNEWTNQEAVPKGLYHVCCKIPGNLLNEGNYLVSIAMFSPPNYPSSDAHHLIRKDVINFKVIDEHKTSGARGYYPYEMNPNAVIRPKLEWNEKKLR